MRRYPFLQFDVFTSTPLEGNPLAIFPDGRGLSDDEMQAVAREMNLSETTFVLPRDLAIERERGVRVRIFTTEEELPFAGHPTLGTAYYLHRQSGAAEVRLELSGGTIPVTFRTADGEVFGEMRQNDPEFGSLHGREPIAHVAGLAVDDIDASLPIQTVSTGLAFVIVPLRSRRALERMHFDLHRATEYVETSDAKFLYFVSREARNPQARLEARMIFGNGEDPATGSAAGCCAAWMVAHGVAKPGEAVLIEQGHQVHRLSRLHVRADREGDRVVNVRVGGHTVEVLRGEVAW